MLLDITHHYCRFLTVQHIYVKYKVASAFIKSEDAIKLFLPTEDSTLYANHILLAGAAIIFPDMTPEQALKQIVITKNHTKKTLTRKTTVARHAVFAQGRVHSALRYAIVRFKAFLLKLMDL